MNTTQIPHFDYQPNPPPPRPHRARKVIAIIFAVIIVLLAVLAGTGLLSGPQPAAAPPAPRHQTQVLTTLAACQRIRADITANGGTPDKPALLYIYRHAQDQKIALLARDAAQQVSSDFHTAMLILQGICSRQGVQFQG